MHATTYHARLMLEGLQGKAAHSCRDALDLFDWTNCWPVVDGDGDLTGDIAEDAADGFVLVDISDSGTITPDGCEFAMDDGEAAALFEPDEEPIDELDYKIEDIAPGATGKMFD